MRSYECNAMLEENAFQDTEAYDSTKATPLGLDRTTMNLPTFSTSDTVVFTGDSHMLPTAKRQDQENTRSTSLSASSDQQPFGIARLVLRDTIDRKKYPIDDYNSLLQQAYFTTPQHSLSDMPPIKAPNGDKEDQANDLSTKNGSKKTTPTSRDSQPNDTRESILFAIQNSPLGNSDFYAPYQQRQQRKAVTNTAKSDPAQIKNSPIRVQNPLNCSQGDKKQTTTPSEKSPIETKKTSLFSRLFSCCMDDTCE